MKRQLLISFSLVAGHEIIGAPKCKTCHKAKTGDQWKIWTESAHAKAFETLASEEAKKIAADKKLGDPQTEDACLKCHTTKAFLGSEVVVNEIRRYRGRGVRSLPWSRVRLQIQEDHDRSGSPRGSRPGDGQDRGRLHQVP